MTSMTCSRGSAFFTDDELRDGGDDRRLRGLKPLTYREASWVDSGAPLALKTSIRIIRGLICALAALANGLHLAFRQSTARMVPHNWFLGIYLQARGRRLIGSTSRDQAKGRIAPFFIIEKRASALTSTQNRDPQTPVSSYRPSLI